MEFGNLDTLKLNIEGLKEDMSKAISTAYDNLKKRHTPKLYYKRTYAALGKCRIQL